MFGSSSWTAFVAGIGLLIVVLSGGSGASGGLSLPMLVVGLVVTAAGAYSFFRGQQKK